MQSDRMDACQFKVRSDKMGSLQQAFSAVTLEYRKFVSRSARSRCVLSLEGNDLLQSEDHTQIP